MEASSAESEGGREGWGGNWSAGRQGRWGPQGWGEWEKGLTSSQFCPMPLPKRNKTKREMKLIFLTENWRF